MYVFPAIDLYDSKAVRLYKGDYDKMTVYSDDPVSVAKEFEAEGCHCIHIVDLEGARDGTTPNIDTVKKIISETKLFCEIGGGIRNIEVAKKYIDAGVDRIILGTAAVTDNDFLCDAVNRFGKKTSVGADVKDGMISIKGWTEKSDYTLEKFLKKMQNTGIDTVICTDISLDGAMRGTNLEMYRTLIEKFSVNITASGGVSSVDDITALREMGAYAAIIGKAYYTGAIDLKKALEAANDNKAHYSVS